MSVRSLKNILLVNNFCLHKYIFKSNQSTYIFGFYHYFFRPIRINYQKVLEPQLTKLGKKHDLKSIT